MDAHAAVRAPGAAHDRASAEVVLGRRAARAGREEERREQNIGLVERAWAKQVCSQLLGLSNLRVLGTRKAPSSRGKTTQAEPGVTQGGSGQRETVASLGALFFV